MEKLAVVLMKPPYGDINAAEAVRHALGAVGEELEVSLLLVDGGAQAARRGQVEGNSGFTNIGAAVQDCVEMGVGVYVEADSLSKEQIEEADLIAGISLINTGEVSRLIKQADKTLIF